MSTVLPVVQHATRSMPKSQKRALISNKTSTRNDMGIDPPLDQTIV
jgi:hypothetical protein